jgi:ATP-dependent Clp protease ATP-binding subunit ClpA
VFHALDEKHLKQIVDIQLASLRQRLADRHIRLTLTDAARTHLVKTGYDPVYGARPLKRAIQKQVETRLGRLIISGKVHDAKKSRWTTTQRSPNWSLSQCLCRRNGVRNGGRLGIRTPDPSV